MSSRPPAANRTEYMMTADGGRDIREAVCNCDGPVGVMMCYEPGNLPSAERLENLMQGFDSWGVMTADSPSDEMAQRGIAQPMQCHVTDQFDAAIPISGGLIGSGSHGGLAHLGPEPYVYRYLYPGDRPMLGLNPNNYPGTSPRPTIPAGSVDAMTVRQLGGRGNVYGTDRISVTERLLSANEYMRSSPNSTEIVRVSTNGLNYLTHQDLVQALNRRIAEMERLVNDDTLTRRQRNQIGNDLRNARIYRDNYLVRFREGHLIGRPVEGRPVVPPSAVSTVYSASNPTAAQRIRLYSEMGNQEFRSFLGTHRTTVRVTGGVLMVVGAIGSANRIYQANPDQRPRVITQEAGLWTGAIVGSWGGAKAGAALGAMIGSVVPGVGTAVGAVVGGLIGMFVGGAIGGWAGATGADYMYTHVIDESDSQAALGHGLGGGGYDLVHQY